MSTASDRPASDDRPARPAVAGGRRLERATFLAEASRLLAQALEYEATLQTVATMAMPELGAWVIVDLVEDDGRVRRLAVVHPDPAKQALARELEGRYPPAVDDPLGAPSALRSRGPELVAEVTDSLLVRSARDARHLEILRALGMGSFMVAPMIARGEVLGAMTFVSAGDGRRYDADDLVLAEDLANRCALAVDNARLYRLASRAREDAVVAQGDAERGRGDAERARSEALDFGIRAQESERAKSDFLSTMSHELRTPLNAVLGYADLLLAGVEGALSAPQRTFVERQRAAGRHLLGLVNDVLDIAKADANQLHIQHEPADAREAVRSAVAMLQPQAARRRVSLHVEAERSAGDGADDAPAIYLGDERRVEQVLINLLGNAVKFTPPGGRVRVLIERRDDDAGGAGWLLVHVRDTGVGIARDAQARVFEPFVQLEEGKTRAVDGSGLGLAIARRIARLMGGDVTLESVPGLGSAFTLWLRAAGAHEIGVATDGDRPPGRERRGPERFARGIAEVGETLLRVVDEVVQRYAARVRDDPAIPAAARAPWTELENHTAMLLADVAQALSVVEEAAGRPAELMRLGDELRGVVSERHGQRRAQLGWTLAGLERDADILEQEVAAAVRSALPPAPALPVDQGLALMGKLLARAREVARDGFTREVLMLEALLRVSDGDSATVGTVAETP